MNSDTSDPSEKKTRRFRSMVRKHRRSIAEEAARTRDLIPTHPPPYDQVVLIPQSDAKPSKSDHPKGHHHQGDEPCMRETVWGKIKTGWKTIYRVLGLRHWLFIAFIIGYAFAGGAVFSKLERKHFEKENMNKMGELAVERDGLIRQILSITNDSSDPDEALDALLKDYQLSKSLFPRTDIHWDIWDGVFYSYTLFTTIGYGHFVPTSNGGRVATMVYSLFGIPLLLAVLADFGKLLTRILKRLYTPIRHTLTHIWQLRKKKAKGEDTCISAEETQQLDQFDFPIPLALLMVSSWIFICAALFQLWETEFSYFECFYFFFISLSTIGLGDITPNHPKDMIASFPLILIGLTLVSLVINLIQNKIDQFRTRAQDMLEKNLGWDTVSASECDSQEGDGMLDIEGQKPPPSTSGRLNLGNVAVGVMQAHNLKAKRRRIGTQTEESYVRDVLHGDPSGLASKTAAQSQITPRFIREPKTKSTGSLSSTSYFDAISFYEPF